MSCFADSSMSHVLVSNVGRANCLHRMYVFTMQILTQNQNMYWQHFWLCLHMVLLPELVISIYPYHICRIWGNWRVTLEFSPCTIFQSHQCLANNSRLLICGTHCNNFVFQPSSHYSTKKSCDGLPRLTKSYQDLPCMACQDLARIIQVSASLLKSWPEIGTEILKLNKTYHGLLRIKQVWPVKSYQGVPRVYKILLVNSYHGNDSRILKLQLHQFRNSYTVTTLLICFSHKCLCPIHLGCTSCWWRLKTEKLFTVYFIYI